MRLVENRITKPFLSERSYRTLMPLVSVLLKSRLALVLAVLSVSACSSAPLIATPPVATQTPVLFDKVISPTLAPTTMPEKSTVVVTVKPSADSAREAVVADWEEMFRTTQSYESVKANGQPGDKNWWIEQSKRFYTGRALALRLQYIDQVFMPGTLSVPGLIENAHYTVEFQGCSSSAECALQVRMQSGQYWVYDVRGKSWNKANSVKPVTWSVSMRYDPVTGHWKIQ
jgi:hypothetical protein